MKDLEVTLHCDGDPAVRENAHKGYEVETLKARVRSLEFDCAELQKQNGELSERVKKLATQKPSWPKGYRPKRKPFNKKVN